MVIITPTIQEYTESVERLSKFFSDVPEKTHWVIYGSFINRKVRPGLSDIDIFVMCEGDDILFPIEISLNMGRVKDEIEKLGIPLQISKTTIGSISNGFTTPDFSYLKEVKKGIQLGYCSGDFSSNFLQLRNEENDDYAMARHFLRKINKLGESFVKVNLIITKDQNEINGRDQKELRSLWDHFKKFLSFYTISLRILSRESHFSKRDSYILSKIEDNFGANTKEYLNTLSSIKNINDWYNFLKSGGLEKIYEIYNQVFIPSSNIIAKKLETYE